jgi:hypothetical protein
VSLNFLTGVSSRPGVSGACKISRSSSTDISVLYGLKTFAKWSVSTFALYISLFTPSTPSVRRGGIGVCGHFSLFVAFHNSIPWLP